MKADTAKFTLRTEPDLLKKFENAHGKITYE